MNLVYNRKEVKEKRQLLRHQQTEMEKRIWQYLRGKQIEKTKFFRQYSVGPYILDFYCPKQKLAIELDGGQHSIGLQHNKDLSRSAYLKKYGITVLRFWNNEVSDNLTGVLEVIYKKIKENSSLPAQAG